MILINRKPHIYLWQGLWVCFARHKDLIGYGKTFSEAFADWKRKTA